MASKDPTERSMIARLAVHTRWAGINDRAAATAPARKAAMERFEHQVDPDGTLPPTVRAQRADSARKAYFTRLALKSAQARKLRARAAQVEAEVEAKLTAIGGEACA